MPSGRAILLLSLAACGPPAVVAPPRPPPPAPKPALPTLDGRVFYDVPIEEAPPPVKVVWDRLRRLDGDPLAAPEPTERDLWMREEMKPWFDRRVAALADLREDVEELSRGAPRDRLVARLFEARVFDAVTGAIVGLEKTFDP